MTTARLDALKWQLEEYGGGLPTSECRELIVALEAALARAERAEKALEQAIELCDIRAEDQREDGGDSPTCMVVAKGGMCQSPFRTALAAVLKAKGNQ